MINLRDLLLCSCVLTVSLPSVAVAANSCTVESVNGGKANVRRNGTFKSVTKAMSLTDDDRIRTGTGATVTVTCSNEMRIVIGPDTMIDLGTISGADQTWAAFLMEGVSWFVRPFFDEERFEVRTPSAVASVRSTEWFVEVKDGATAVFVDQGSVAVDAIEGNALVTSSLGIDVTKAGIAGPVKSWGAKRVQALKARFGSSLE